MSMPRQLNPEETALFAADMSRIPTEHGADVGLKWRERCVNLISAYQNPLADTLAFIGAGGYIGAIGWWQGYNELERDKVVLEWQTVTAPALKIDPKAVPEPFQDVFDAQGKLVFKAVKDPTKLGPIPVTLYPTGVLALVAALNAGGAHYNRFIAAPAVAGVGFAVGSIFRDLAYKAGVKKQAEMLAAATTTTPTTTGGEGNPYRGFPRAA